MVNLGSMYQNGLGVPKDLAQARKWYEMAAAAGDESAKASLKQLDASKRK
jgi:TPR repeat protein